MVDVGDEPGALPAQTNLVGREAERSILAVVQSELARGRGRVVAVEGSAGMGKTALLGEHARSARQDGVAVLWAHGTEVDQIRPFGCLLDVLGSRLNHPDPAHRRVAEAVVASARADYTIDTFQFESTSSWRLPVQEAIVDLFEEMLDRSPVLLVVDDVQWADTGTLGTMLALSRRCGARPMELAWTLRSSLSHEVLDQITDRSGGRLVRIQVGPLRVADSLMLGAELLGQRLDEQQKARLSRAGGNPFFIRAVAGHGAEGATANEAILGWIGRLPNATGEVLSIASILGSSFDAGVLAALTDRSPGELVELLQPAVAAGLLQTGDAGRYRFEHDLIRSALEEDLPRSVFRALEREAAKVLQKAGADPGVVAHHLARGAHFGDEVAAEQIRSACVRVVRHDAPSAVDLLGVAVSLCAPGSHTWAAATADRVIALQWAGRGAEALDLANSAISQPMSKSETARLRIARATRFGLVNDLRTSAEEYRMLAYDAEIEPQVRAQVLAELATLEAWGLDRTQGRKHAQEAIGLAQICRAPRAELQAICSLSTMALFDGEVREAISYGREAVLRGRSFPGLSPPRELYLGMALANADEINEGAIWMNRGQAAADAVSDLWQVSRYQLARMGLSLNTGDWDVTMAEAEAVIALHEDTGMASGMPQAPATAGIVALRRGDSDDHVTRFRALAAASAMAGAETTGLFCFAWLEALIAEREGRLDDAVGTLQFVFDSVGNPAPLTQLWLAPDLIRMLLATNDHVRASSVARQIAPCANRAGAASALGAARLCEGLVRAATAPGMAGGAAEVLRESADLLRAARWKPMLLAALEALGDAGGDALVQGERRRLQSEMGIHIRESEGTIAEASGGARRATGRRPIDTLTPTERTIASLVAEGLANPHIAVRLGVSKRTVEYHLSNIYPKLGVATRVALASAARSIVR